MKLLSFILWYLSAMGFAVYFIQASAFVSSPIALDDIPRRNSANTTLLVAIILASVAIISTIY